jgi:hypothetical protein
MDMTSFLKMVPGAIGLAGLLTILMSPPKPTSDLPFVNMVQNARNNFLMLGCVGLILLSVWLIYRPAPPDRDAALPGEHSLMIQESLLEPHNQGSRKLPASGAELG